MVKQTIRIFCRIKPTKQALGIYGIDQDDGNGNPKLSFSVPRDLADGFVNNKKEVYNFRFDDIFDQKTKQDEIFDVVAKPTVDSVLSGFNGTLFAYGQTGSGKTFTITGGAERYVDRGIIPRTLSYIFEEYEKTATHVYTTHISYLEIYNEYGYDLLDPKHEATKLEDLPKVSLMEDNDGNIHLKNLSLHSANNEEEALNLLFLGDTNRMIAETPMNQASTRSHCIFTIHITARESGSATIRRSKLHLVDLAGSERVSKTGVGGVLLKEAKYINLSLHFLEQVIIALSEKARTHIPYRNSMMTSVLRDSLGGNCMTSMIATCSIEKRNIDESISTCRFAQRVALIKNDALVNEEMDPKLMIARLKQEIQGLKDELALATGQEYDGQLDEEGKERLRYLVKTYVNDGDKEAVLSVGADMRKINFCFFLLKEHVLSRDVKSVNSSRSQISTTHLTSVSTDVDTSYLAEKNEIQKLKDLIKQRDNEINILVSMLKKEKQNTRNMSPPHRNEGIKSKGEWSSQSSTSETSTYERNETRPPDPVSGRQSRNALVDGIINKQKEMSAGRQEAFDVFRKEYFDNRVIEENKKLLKNKYGEAKGLGEQVNRSRKQINSIKAKIEQNRLRRSVQDNVTANGGDSSFLEEEEQSLRSALDHEKARYRNAFAALKALKTEIEHLQHLLEMSKVKLQKDFELWWVEKSNKVAEEKDDKLRTRPAWRTPPSSAAKQENLQGYSVDEARKTKNIRKNSAKKEALAFPSDNTCPTREQLLKPSMKGNLEQWNPETHDFSGYQVGSVASKLQAEVNKSTHSLMQRVDTDDGQHMEEIWKSANTAVSQGSTGSDIIQLTDDSQANADILAFMKARQSLLRNKHPNQR